MPLCFPPLGSLTLQAFQIIPLHPCLSPPCRAGPGDPGPAQRTVVSHLLPGPSSCINITHCHTVFSSNHTPVNSHGTPAWLFQELLTRQLALPLYFVANFEPKRTTFPNVHITQHLLDLNLRQEATVRGVPSGSVCGCGWLVFEVLLSSRAGGLGGNRALWFTAADCLLGQDPRGTGPPGLQGPASLTGCPLSEALCLSSLWSLVSDLSPRPHLLPHLSPCHYSFILLLF